MVFIGYLGFGGTEIVNGGRVSSYVRTLQPNMEVEACAECADLHEALGHKPYTSPLVDQPDWFDADNPDTWDFYGLYPLSFEGFEDATTEATITQFNQDGGAVSRPRRGTRSVRVTALMIGASDAAVSAGMTWLRQALRPVRCRDGTDCTGDHLCYFVACPPLCVEDQDDLIAAPTHHDPYRECETGVVIEPIRQCTFAYERHLYEATCVSGPRVTQVFAPECGAMTKIEFTIVAGVPSPFGTAVHVATGPSGPLVTVANQTCQPDSNGMQVLRQQLALNPAPSATGGWLTGDAARFTVTRDGPSRRDGHPTVKVTRTATGGTGSMIATITNLGAYSAAATAQPRLSTTVPQLTYVASLYARSSVPGHVTLNVQPTTEAGAAVGAVFTATKSFTGAWTRVWVQFTAPATATRVVISSTAGTGGTTATVGSFVAYSDVLLEKDYGAPLGWFDGNTVSVDDDLDYVWSGTAGQSYSELQMTVPGTGPILDPDCATVPAAPRPPAIAESCITDPLSYVRYTAEVPADAVPQWSDAVPIIRIYSGDAAVRQMRVRFYDNAFEVAPDQLDPCVFCGEFIVSYLPADSLLTIDGITQTATVTQRGQLAQTASHLLYGTGGGPMVWPHLTCGIRYDMTVDIVPNVTDLVIDLCVAGRE